MYCLTVRSPAANGFEILCCSNSELDVLICAVKNIRNVLQDLEFNTELVSDIKPFLANPGLTTLRDYFNSLSEELKNMDYLIYEIFITDSFEESLEVFLAELLGDM